MLLPRVNSGENITTSLAGIFYENPIHHSVYLLFSYPAYFGFMNSVSLSFDFSLLRLLSSLDLTSPHPPLSVIFVGYACDHYN